MISRRSKCEIDIKMKHISRSSCAARANTLALVLSAILAFQWAVGAAPQQNDVPATFSQPALGLSPQAAGTAQDIGAADNPPQPREATQAATDPKDRWPKNEIDFNFELIDYGDDVLDSLTFVQTLKNLKSNESIESMINKHHNFEEMESILRELNKLYPDITRLYSVGESAEGRKLWVLEISEQAGKHVPLKPEFRYIANMHGNEVVGRELMLHLARLLVENYKAAVEEEKQTPTAKYTKPTGPKFVKKLLAQTRIHLMPSMNPDGYARSEVACKFEPESKRGRLNANNEDLNRNFPDIFESRKPDAATQPETLAVMNWSREEPFVLSANLHGGALVVVYPYDGNKNISIEKGVDFVTPDDDVFRHVSHAYAMSHPTMMDGKMCYDQCTEYHPETFPGGITNGGKWYAFRGSLCDWLYEHTSELDVTIEMGCNQYPPANTLSQYWQYNKKALINFIRQTHRGIKGLVQDAKTGAPIPGVRVKVKGRDHTVTSSKYGDYFRILVPGIYDIAFEHPDYSTQEIHVQLRDTMAQIHSIKLQPLHQGQKPTSSQPESSTEIIMVDDQGDSQVDKKTGEDSKTSDDHSIIVAILVMTIVIVILLICMVGAFVVQRRFITRSRSMSVELQQTSAGQSRQAEQLAARVSKQAYNSGSSINPNL